jgi:hypothetical protein
VRNISLYSEGPKTTNYFLESRNVVPHRSEYKAPPVLLSRKGPIVQSQPSRPPPGSSQIPRPGNEKTTSAADQESSEDEEEVKARELTLAERQAQAAKEREEKQRRYEERRKELFGDSSAGLIAPNAKQGIHTKSGNSSPGSLTPPGSRSATPSRGRGGRGSRRGGALGDHNTNSRNQSKGGSQRELFDHSYEPMPDSAYIQRREREDGSSVHPNTTGIPQPQVQLPIRAPRGPDGSGRGGFGFAKPSKSMPAESPSGANVLRANAETFTPSATQAAFWPTEPIT